MSTLVVVPHPDDEVIGAGIWLHRHAETPLYIVHVTDGSPRDMRDAHSHGFSTPEAYAAARSKEFADACRLIPVSPDHCFHFSVPDKEAYLNAAEIVKQLQTLIQLLQPEIVMSPAYEGGHPDHDTTAFAVAAARRCFPAVAHWEFPLYHADPLGNMVMGSFVSGEAAEVLELTPMEQELKRSMFACFSTQQEFLRNFRLATESFRPAPVYDFKKNPHPGPLLYERWGWGIDSSGWRARVNG